MSTTPAPAEAAKAADAGFQRRLGLFDSTMLIVGTMIGSGIFVVILTGSIAAVGIAFAKYLGVLVPWLGTDYELYRQTGFHISLSLPWMNEPFFEMKKFVISSGQLVAVLVIAFLTWLNCRGIQ